MRNGAAGKTKLVLGKVEDLVPEPGLKVALHLGKGEVRVNTRGDGERGVVVEVEAKVKRGSQRWGGRQPGGTSPRGASHGGGQ